MRPHGTAPRIGEFFEDEASVDARLLTSADAAGSDARGESGEPTGTDGEPTLCDRMACLFTPLREIDAGLNSPTAVLAATVRAVPDASGACERLVPVSYLDIAPPKDEVAPCFAAAGTVHATPQHGRPRPLAMPFCFAHRPLYFEDPNLERCGVSTGPCTQPLVSAGHFFGTVPLLPWWAATRPPQEPVRATPFCPPGRKYDFAANYLPPAEAPGALAEAAAAAAFFVLLP